MDPITLALSLAGQFAPSIIKYLTNSDTAVEVATQVIETAKVVTGESKPSQAADMLRANPELAMQFQEKMAAQEADLEKAYLADRADARRRDIALIQAGQTNRRADVMVLIDAIGLIACLVVLMFYRQGMPEGVVTLITTIASIFGLCLRDAHQFEFGSSRSSQQKTDLLLKK